MRRIVICGLKPEYIPFVTSIQGWAQQPSLEEFENLLSSQELLAKQLASVFVKGEENALVANKRNFKGKTRDVPHSRSSGGSRSPGEKEESSNYYGKKPLRCYRYGEVGHIKRYCRAKESSMAQKVVEEEEEWGNCLVAEARAIDAMISINTEKGWIEDIEYNIADHVEKQDTDVIDMKQQTLEDVHTGDMVASIVEIKELDSEQAVPIYADGDLYGESIEEDVWEVEVSDQSSAILRPVIGLDQILEANKENANQIDEEATTNEISQYYVVASEEECSKILSIRVPNLSIIDVSPNSTIAGKLRERGSLGTQRRDDSHGSFDNGKSLSFDEARGVRKKLLRSSPRRGSKLRLSSSTTSVG
uniref:CCHC-type domain-containing protein n=1 Tax=Solanum tuberosum TaxID=4113 RepID=M1C9B9_SOLTU